MPEMSLLYNNGLTKPNKGLPAAILALFISVMNPATTERTVVVVVVEQGGGGGVGG